MVKFNMNNANQLLNEYLVVRTDIADWGERFNASEHARPYRHKNRKALTNWRSSNKKKLHKFINR